MREFLQSSYLSRLQLRKKVRQSAAFSSKTEKLDLGRKKVSGEAGRLGVSFYRQEKQRRDSDAL